MASANKLGSRYRPAAVRWDGGLASSISGKSAGCFAFAAACTCSFRSFRMSRHRWRLPSITMKRGAVMARSRLDMTATPCILGVSLKRLVCFEVEITLDGEAARSLDALKLHDRNTAKLGGAFA